MGLPHTFDIRSDATIYWWGLARDDAGNLGILDRPRPSDDTYHPCFPPDFPRDDLEGTDVTAAIHVGGCLPYTARIDNTGPTIERVITGRWWDSSKDGDDKTEYDPTKARNDSILVRFSEDMDPSTIQSSDFRVDGAVPLKAEVFDGRKDYVFLTVSPLAADATPKVEMVGDVRDLAGNYYGAGDTEPTPTPTPEPTPDPTPTPTPVSLDFLVLVLREARDLGGLSDALSELISDGFIIDLIAPVTGETPDEARVRLSSNESLGLLISVLREAEAIGVLPGTMSGLLSDWLIEYLIAPVTGETADEVRERLTTSGS